MAEVIAQVKQCFDVALGRCLPVPAKSFKGRFGHPITKTIAFAKVELCPRMAPLGLLLVQADAADIPRIAEQTLTGAFVEARPCFIALNTDFLSTAYTNDVTALNQLRASNAAQGIAIGVQDALERGGRQRRSSGILHGRQPARRSNSSVELLHSNKTGISAGYPTYYEKLRSRGLCLEGSASLRLSTAVLAVLSRQKMQKMPFAMMMIHSNRISRHLLRRKSPGE